MTCSILRDREIGTGDSTKVGQGDNSTSRPSTSHISGNMGYSLRMSSDANNAVSEVGIDKNGLTILYRDV